MQYVRSISSSVSNTWNSINPATLSGAIDVIVVEQEDGELACSPFHVRFGKFQLLQPREKKVEFRVNGSKQDYSMKLGEGGEAFFVFETTESIPAALQTSPLVSPETSPQALPAEVGKDSLLEPEPLDLASDAQPKRRFPKDGPRPKTVIGDLASLQEDDDGLRPALLSDQWPPHLGAPIDFGQSISDRVVPSSASSVPARASEPPEALFHHHEVSLDASPGYSATSHRSSSPPPVSQSEAMARAIHLSKRLWTSNIPSRITDTGDLMLDMTGYKSSEEQILRAEVVARKILSEELEGNYDIGALIGTDETGNLWIYSSEERKEAAERQNQPENGISHATAMGSTDAISDPGYHSDDGHSDAGTAVGDDTGLGIPGAGHRRDSDSAVGLSTPPKSPMGNDQDSPPEPSRNYAKTLRLTSDQLKALKLRQGSNSMSFTVNKATCQACIYFWRHDVPIVISDIDGTITKSDVLGHVLTTIGRDWTHLGVSKLYTDIAANGYNLMYLTSRSVGQADTTRAYLNGIVQEGHRIPKGPVILSPDRTIAALRREVYLRKPEVFKMACLRDIMSLFNKAGTPQQQPGVHHPTPFYAGFGNRLTDALSYRSVNIPSTRIFTINSNSEVSLDLLSLNKYKTGYASMREIVDHFFPPVGLLVKSGGEDFTDFNYWRSKPLELDEFTASESGEELEEGDEDAEGSEGADELAEDLEASYISRDSFDQGGNLDDSIMESIEGDVGDEDEGIFEEADKQLNGTPEALPATEINLGSATDDTRESGSTSHGKPKKLGNR
ncbi:LNS2-domain-containing protein [Eremomyces bilateralis CBS 781.70]|uniref:LNS2-domain-containing protein n=1 Tax=Eremomyces bilateralis CBS 781.70 TaxID=1392243 RepID=A0A6G1G3M8_9PEZI|nr:LNS2-domain-containing protein [Eremomyces bilateralis CBS 781.70]KAF1812419.1 LNS2-domain-containing protein [Eremomyces bilateralis CBS 781.70]